MFNRHILDTHLGKPATDVVVRLFLEDGRLIREAKTNTDGRVSDFGMVDLNTGIYSLEFFTSAYFENLGLETFFPKAVIHFYIKDASQHFHIPLLISPFAYSTYRGS